MLSRDCSMYSHSPYNEYDFISPHTQATRYFKRKPWQSSISWIIMLLSEETNRISDVRVFALFSSYYTNTNRMKFSQVSKGQSTHNHVVVYPTQPNTHKHINSLRSVGISLSGRSGAGRLQNVTFYLSKSVYRVF